VRQNNPKAYVPHRYDPVDQPTGDPDCRLGVKTSSNQERADSTIKQTKEYVWGYGSGVAAATDPGYGDVVLAEYTQPFNEVDSIYYHPLYARAAAAAVLAALLPRLPLAPAVLAAVVGPLLPPALAADARARVLAELAAWPLDQDALAAGDAARAAFVAANRRLVLTVARRYAHRGLPLDDLVQEGTVGLLRAVDLFDPARGYKFSTYAVWWIKQALRRALATQVPLVHVPINVQDERARLARQAHALHAALGHPPSPGELAAATGVPLARVDALTAPLPAPVPLDQIMGDGETTTLGDLLPDPDADQPDALAEAHALAAAVRAALATLDPRARAILVARHGLDGVPPRTLQEIGRSLGLTRQAVQQAEARALARLRHPALHRWLTDAPAS